MVSEEKKSRFSLFLLRPVETHFLTAHINGEKGMQQNTLLENVQNTKLKTLKRQIETVHKFIFLYSLKMGMSRMDASKHDFKLNMTTWRNCFKEGSLNSPSPLWDYLYLEFYNVQNTVCFVKNYAMLRKTLYIYEYCLWCRYTPAVEGWIQ